MSSLWRRLLRLEKSEAAPKDAEADIMQGFDLADHMQRIDRHVYPDLPPALQRHLDSTPSLYDKLAALERLIEFGPTGRPAAAEAPEDSDEPILLSFGSAPHTTVRYGETNGR